MARREYGYEMEPMGDQYGRNQCETDPRGSHYGSGAPEQHCDLGDGDGVIFQQPGRMGFSNGPGGGVPRGLEYMTQVDQLLVQQKMKRCGNKRNYKIANSAGQQVYSSETTAQCMRECWHGFDMRVLDNYDQEVLHLSRPLRRQDYCCSCCLQQLEVTSGDGQLLGTVCDRLTFSKPELTVHGPDGRHVFTLRGPTSLALPQVCSCGDTHFRILKADDDHEVGQICRYWPGMMDEFIGFTDNDTFSVTFPIDLDVGLKATLFAAVIQIDLLYFEA